MLYLPVAQMPRSPNLVIFVLTTTDGDRRQTKLIILPLAHVRWVIRSLNKVKPTPIELKHDLKAHDKHAWEATVHRCTHTLMFLSITD